MSRLEIVAKLPSLVIKHLQPVGRIAASYICPSTVDLSKVQGGSQVSEFPKAKLDINVSFSAVSRGRPTVMHLKLLNN